MNDVTLQVEVQGRNPDELIAAAIAHADRFFGARPPQAYKVELSVVYPAVWNSDGQVARRQADAVVRPRPPKASGGCTC